MRARAYVCVYVCTSLSLYIYDVLMRSTVSLWFLKASWALEALSASRLALNRLHVHFAQSAKGLSRATEPRSKAPR